MLKSTQIPPGQAGRPYILEALCGEVIYIPLSKSATRLLITGKESENAFAIVGTGGSQGDPIGFHYHRETHDVFLCLKGSVNVWANDQCRTLGPGDLASVPPNTIHQYQILGDYTEFVGLIVPGGWEEFFRFIGEPYSGPMFPLVDERNIFEVLIPKLKAAADKFDMIPVRDHPSVQPQPWQDGQDNRLPGSLEPYFLRSGTGPRYLVGGVVISPLVSIAESGGRFSIACVEGSSWHHNPVLSETFQFNNVHHAVQVADGLLELKIADEQATLAAGETSYIPKAISFSLRIRSRYAKLYFFISGSGLVDLLCQLAQPYDQTIPPETPASWDKQKMESLVEKYCC